MELFVCSSNYQLLNAILIVKEYKITADLVVTRESIWDTCDLTVLVKAGIFKTVYKWTYLLEKISDEKIRKPIDKLKIQIRKIAIYLNKTNIWDSLPNKEKKYTTVHLAYVDSVSLWIFSYYKRSGATLSIYEDGTYSYGCLGVKKSTFRRICEIILYRSTGIDECLRLYIKHPEQVIVGSHKNVQLLRFDGKFDTQIISDVLFPLYKTGEKSVESFGRKAIIFDQNLELDAIKQTQKKIADQTAQIFGTENVIVKLHPSSRDVAYSDSIFTFSERIPFELVLTYFDMTDRLLISIFSTACMSPKLDFNQEPFIIFTYKIFRNYFSFDNNYLEQIRKLCNIYSDKSKIAIPEDMDELFKILYRFKERLK